MLTTPSSLIRRVRDPTDAESWREFVALYEPLLLSYVRSLGVPMEDARDVVQDVFARLVRALPEFELDHTRGRFRTWLRQVANSAIADWARRKRHQAKEEEAWRDRLAAMENASGEESDADWEAAHHKRVLDFVLSRVRTETQPKTWACFEQHALQGRPSADVGAELGPTTNAVCEAMRECTSVWGSKI